MNKVVERFIKYLKYNTKPEKEDNENFISSQLKLAKELVKELKDIGMKDISLDKHGYVMATLPSNIDKEVPVIGFIAHIDTSTDVLSTNVKPKFVENYNGEDIILNEEQNIILSPKEFPELRNYIGKTLITTDGTTFLGADNKAGIAEIMTAMDFLIKNPKIKHGDIRIAFTADKELGRIAKHFDVEKFNADLAYTFDGGVIGDLEYENFNAASARIAIKGINTHTGNAKGRMINSIRIASEFIDMFPENEAPEATEGYEGFYHVVSIGGSVEETKIHYLIRDFDEKNFEKRKKFIIDLIDNINKKYGPNIATIEITDQYKNMKEKIESIKYVIDIAIEAMKEVNVFPDIKPIRGGTDGARLSYIGIPTPNIFSGGHNFYSKHEYIPTYSMEKAVEVIVKIVELFAEI